MKKKMLISAAVICVCLWIGVFYMLHNMPKESAPNEVAAQIVDSTIPEDPVDDGHSLAEGIDTDGDGIEDYFEEEVIDEEEYPDGTSWKELLKELEEKEKNKGQIQTPEKEEVQAISFPCMIPNTSIRAESIASYDGLYLENGSDREIDGVTALILTNTGSEALEYADIAFGGLGNAVSFRVTDIPAGSTAVVLESSMKSYNSGYFSECIADTAYTPTLEQSADQIEITETEEGSLAVKNLTQEDIPAVRVFYKFYMDSEDTYVGGITYTAKVTDLKSSDTAVITPSHYVSGYSKVVMVRTYNTKE